MSRFAPPVATLVAGVAVAWWASVHEDDAPGAASVLASVLVAVGAVWAVAEVVT